MLSFCYEWLENISYFLVLAAVVIHLLPGEGYRRYVRFYLGLILISLVLGPIWNLKSTELPDLDRASVNLERRLTELEMEYEKEYGSE